MLIPFCTFSIFSHIFAPVRLFHLYVYSVLESKRKLITFVLWRRAKINLRENLSVEGISQILTTKKNLNHSPNNSTIVQANLHHITYHNITFYPRCKLKVNWKSFKYARQKDSHIYSICGVPHRFHYNN